MSDVEDWFFTLAEKDAARVAAAIDLLEERGPNLGRPLVDSLTATSIHNLKELRPGSMRLLFAFDRNQEAIILVAGDKAGQWSQWYKDNIPRAEERYTAWTNGYSVER